MKILVIGDPHGVLKVNKSHLEKADLVLVTGDIGKADLMRKMFFEDIERRRKGLLEKEHSSLKKKRAFMEAYNSSMKIMRHLSKRVPTFTIYGNVETSNSDTKKYSKEIGADLPLLTKDLNSLDNVRVINNRIANFKGIRIGGLEYFVDTSWVKDFKPEDYQERMSESRKQTEKAKRILKGFRDLDILICH
jgi:Icc-related predicted phosphoesterase|tara:strand:+ start:167 stop:739 length:573 start_codon:yes stop_codon:yes gene_type:complete